MLGPHRLSFLSEILCYLMLVIRLGVHCSNPSSSRNAIQNLGSRKVKKQVAQTSDSDSFDTNTSYINFSLSLQAWGIIGSSVRSIAWGRKGLRLVCRCSAWYIDHTKVENHSIRLHYGMPLYRSEREWWRKMLQVGRILPSMVGCQICWTEKWPEIKNLHDSWAVVNSSNGLELGRNRIKILVTKKSEQNICGRAFSPNWQPEDIFVPHECSPKGTHCKGSSQ